MSDISFSLYLTHFPVILLIAATFYGNHQCQPNTMGIAQFMVWLGACLFIAVLFWWLFERHTGTVRSKLMALIFRRKITNGDSE